jgi:hypothetical protein
MAVEATLLVVMQALQLVAIHPLLELQLQAVGTAVVKTRQELLVDQVVVVVVEQMVPHARTPALGLLGKEILVVLVLQVVEAAAAEVQATLDKTVMLAVMGRLAQPHLLLGHPLLTLVEAVLADLMVMRQVLAELAVVVMVQVTAVAYQRLVLQTQAVAAVQADGVAVLLPQVVVMAAQV